MTDTHSLIATTGRWSHPHLNNEPSNKADALFYASKDCTVFLYARVKHDYPEAGRRYWSSKTWSLIVWQLIYLSVSCAIRKNVVFCPSIIIQHIKGSSIYGYHIRESTSNTPSEIFTLGSPLPAIIQSAHYLRKSINLFYEQHCHEYLPPQKTALRLAAAIGLSVMIKCIHKISQKDALGDRPFSFDEHKQLSEEWLNAMNLQGEASLINTHQGACVVRRACCMHYVVSPTDICNNCPLRRAKRN